jgi:hypothetical protein
MNESKGSKHGPWSYGTIFGTNISRKNTDSIFMDKVHSSKVMVKTYQTTGYYNTENHNLNFHYHQSFKPLYKPRIFINMNSETHQWKLHLTDNLKWTNREFLLFVIVTVTKSDTDVYILRIKECHCYQPHIQFFPTFNHKVTLHADIITGVFSTDFNMVHILYIHEWFRKHENTVGQDISCLQTLKKKNSN